MEKSKFKLGILVISVLVASFFIINFLRGADVFGREITVYGKYKDIQSLVVSSPVIIKGYTAGRVDKIEYDADSDVFSVECNIDRKFRIPSDSKLVIFSTSLLGGKGIRVDYGKSDILVKNGDTLPSANETDFVSSVTTQFQPLFDKVSILVDTLNLTLNDARLVLNEANRASIQSSLKHLDATLANAEKLSAALGGKSEDLNTIIFNLKSLSNEFSPIASSAKSSIDNISTITSNLKEADLKGTIVRIDKAADELSKTVNRVSVPLDSLLHNADSLITEIKKNPKKYIKITIF